jgi:hypothetical protein
MAADTTNYVSRWRDIEHEEGHTYCTLGAHMFIRNIVEHSIAFIIFQTVKTILW